jgi:hypothetical protein
MALALMRGSLHLGTSQLNAVLANLKAGFLEHLLQLRFGPSRLFLAMLLSPAFTA